MSLFLNSTQIPNIIIDEWMSQLELGEFKVIIAVARKTYGWHKSYDAISVNQLEKMTGLSRRGIQKIVRNLEAKGYITCVQSKHEAGDNHPNCYEINMNYASDRVGQNLTQGVVNSVDQGANSVRGGGALSSQGGAHSVRPQKKLYTKETYTKEREEGLSPTPPPSPKKPPSPEKEKLGELQMVKLTPQELQKLNEKLGASRVESLIRKLDLYLAQKGDKYKSHYATLLKWSEDDKPADGGFKLAKHREGSKLAFEKQKDTWKPDWVNVGGGK